MNIEAGGWADLADLSLHQSSDAFVTVTGAGSKLTASTKVTVGNQVGSIDEILTVEDSGLVQTMALQFGLDNGSGGYVHMGADGVLAVFGDKTGGTPFASGGLFTISGGSSFGEIQYLNGSTWENMTGATEGVDYTLTYAATGGPTINGQDLSGYTVLTVTQAVPESGSAEGVKDEIESF